MTDHKSSEILNTFEGATPDQRAGVASLRSLIFDTAQRTAGVGPLSESLKWGQPSFVPIKPKTGTPIRLGLLKNSGFAVYTHCQTSLIGDFQEQFPNDFKFEGTRAIHFETVEDIKPDILKLFIARALTYHQM